MGIDHAGSFHGSAIRLLSGWERPPDTPAIAAFPRDIGDWKRYAEDPPEADVNQVSRADRLLSRLYRRTAPEGWAHLLVAWYRSQRGGVTQPHQPAMCMLTTGWIPVAEGGLRLDAAAGGVTVKRYIVARRGERNAVLFWYHLPGGPVANEWAAKLWLVRDAARYRRSDATLLRIVVPVVAESADAAEASAYGFAKAAHPELREWLPR